GMAVAHLNRTETDFLYDEVFGRQTYLQHGVTLRDGDCVCDVGANIGLFTLFVQQHCRPSRLLAFEPIPEVAGRLRLNAALYGGPVEVVEAGLARTSGEAEFTYYPHVSIVSGRYADAAAEQAVIKAYLQATAAAEAPEALDDLLAARLETRTVTCR